MNNNLAQRAAAATDRAHRTEQEAADEPSASAFRQAAEQHRSAAGAHRLVAAEALVTSVCSRYRAIAYKHDQYATELERMATRTLR